jgi:squalene monooxygenase
MESKHYDVVIVGAGIAGSALAHALTTLPRPAQAASPLATSSQGAYDVEPARPLRVCMLERSLAEPDRIVGELLQPGGMRALRTLGLAHCTDGIDAVPVRGYVVVKAGELVQIPYPAGAEGRSFHHGRFVQNLRGAVLADASRKEEGDVLATVDVIEATAQELVECAFTRRVIGVRATRKAPAAAPPPTEGPSNLPPPADDDRKETFHADLVVIADGCFSNFRNQVLGPVASKSITKGHFVGLILEDITLPVPQHGTVCLVKNSGPILLYQVAGRDTRMLIDIKNPLPSDLKVTSPIEPNIHRAHRAHRSLRVTSSPKLCLSCLLSFSPLYASRSRKIGSDECPTRSCRRRVKRGPLGARASSCSATRGICATRSRVAG